MIEFGQRPADERRESLTLMVKLRAGCGRCLLTYALTTEKGLTQGFHKRFDALVASNNKVLAGGRKGVEKESLRIDASGNLSRSDHPAALGSALTNNYITTDFSEALLEFVTPAFVSTWETLQFLCDIHQFTYADLDDELLWTASMPCRIPTDAEIPLARYGNSNVGQMKTIYRRGLGHRYGRQMQTIAGVHFNYSLPGQFWKEYQSIIGDSRNDEDFRSDNYLGMIRNFRRFGWLVLYLFGASPALCKSFAGDAGVQMPALNAETWYEPYGTSLRMSDLGYSNQNQSRINISLNNLDDYVRDLSAAIASPEPAYQHIGVKVDGQYRQLNANRLQIENEFYSPVRPKRVAKSGERPTAALQRGGIEYVEIRSLDINIGDPAGINQNTMRFVEAFLIYCLIEDSPPLTDDSLAEAKQNQSLTARQGRNPDLRLQRGSKDVPLAAWALEILPNVQAIAEQIDAEEGGDRYVQAVAIMRTMIDDADATPSARLLEDLCGAQCSFFDYALSVANSHRDYFASITSLSKPRYAQFADEAKDSIDRQRDIEANDKISLDEYLSNYFNSG